MSGEYFILIIEDDESLVQLFAEFFSRKGYRIDTAQTGATALEKLENHAYDLLLIDLKLPDMNGIELVKWIRDHSPDTIAIILSGHATIELTLEAISLGAFDFMIKPVQLARLGIVVQNGLERRRISLQNRKLISELQLAKRDLEARIGQRAEQLKKSEQKFRSLYDNAPDVYYTVDTRGQIIDCNKMATEFFGLTRRQLKAMHLLDLYTSDNFELVSRMVPTADGKGGTVRHQEVRVKRADGSVAEVEINSNLLTDTEGQVLGALTIQRDITDRKRAEERLSESEERYRTIFETAEVALIEVDFSEMRSMVDQFATLGGSSGLERLLDGQEDYLRRALESLRAVDFNQAAIKLLGGSGKQELVGDLSRFYTPESFEGLRRFLLAMAEGRASCHEETSFQTMRGERVITLVSMTVPPAGSRYRNLLVSLVDITERKKVEEEKDLLLTRLHQLNRQLETLAVTDGLTKLYNHRFFMENLFREFSRSQRLEHPLALLIADIDNFKGFNDTYGHQLGDEVLVRVAEVLQKSRRGADIVARYGGEEFVLLLPDTSLEQAVLLAEKLRKKIEDLVLSNGRDKLRLTISIGAFALERDNVKSPKELLIMADKALYLAKKTGKNRVCTIGDTAIASADPAPVPTP